MAANGPTPVPRERLPQMESSTHFPYLSARLMLVPSFPGIYESTGRLLSPPVEFSGAG